MEKNDGGLEETQKQVLTLVSFGNVDNNISYNLRKSLMKFFSSIEDEMGFHVIIKSKSKNEPLIPETGSEIKIFREEMEKIQGNIAIGVTDRGLFDLGAYPKPRNIFGSGYGAGRGILSTKRFKGKENINERLCKEVIKILGLSCGVFSCGNENCILTYHRYVEDIDKNTELCEECRNKMIEAVNFYMSMNER